LEKPRYGFAINTGSNCGRDKVIYTVDDIDFIAAYVARHDAWYVIPIEALGNAKNIRLYPSGRTLKRAAAASSATATPGTCSKTSNSRRKTKAAPLRKRWNREGISRCLILKSCIY